MSKKLIILALRSYLFVIYFTWLSLPHTGDDMLTGELEGIWKKAAVA
jgi:hypothetical protein